MTDAEARDWWAGGGMYAVQDALATASTLLAQFKAGFQAVG